MSKPNKKVKVLIIASGIWFLLAMWLIDEQQGLSDFNDFIEEIPLFLLFNAPLIIGWGIWWMKRE